MLKSSAVVALHSFGPIRSNRASRFVSNRFSCAVLMLLVCCTPSSFAQLKTGNVASAIYEHYHSSVVVVVPLDKDNNPLGQGSGFIIAANRVVTNHHVLANAVNALVLFADGGSQGVEGFVSDSPTRDISIAVVNTGNRLPLKLGDELSLRQGEDVYAIGAPRGLDLSITNGIVSGFRTIDDQFLLQTTAPIAPGSSGGPLFNNTGRVVGVTTSLLTDSPGIYFSVGIGDVTRLLRSASTLILPISNIPHSEKSEVATTNQPDLDSIKKLIDVDDYAAARNKLNPLVEKSPRDPTLNKMLGQIDLYEGKFQSALDHLKVAIDGDPKSNDAKLLYAVGLFFSGRYGEAADIQKLVVKAEASAENLAILAEILYGAGDFTEAELQASNAIAKDPSSSGALEVIAGNIYWGRSTSKFTWLEVQEKLLKAKSNSYWVEVNHALEFNRQNKIDDAITALLNAKKQYFPDPAASYLLSYFYIRKSEVGLARAENSEALTTYPNNANLLNQGMFIALIGHDETLASRYYSRLIGLNKTNDQTAAACLYYYGIGKSVEAVEQCTASAVSSPKNHVAHSNLAWAALDADKFSLSLSEFQQAYSLVKDHLNDLTETETIDLVWGFAIADYYNGDKKNCGELLQILKKSYPATLSVTGLEQVPLVWSRKTMTRIELILREIRP